MREYTAVAASTRIPATTDSAGKHRTILMAYHGHCRGETWRDHNSTRRAAHRTCLTERNTSATCSGGTNRSTREAGLCNPCPCVPTRRRTAMRRSVSASATRVRRLSMAATRSSFVAVAGWSGVAAMWRHSMSRSSSLSYLHINHTECQCVCRLPRARSRFGSLEHAPARRTRHLLLWQTWASLE